MRNKSYLVKQICELSGIDPDSEEGQELYKLKVLELMNKVQELKKYVPPPDFFSNRCGCKL